MKKFMIVDLDAHQGNGHERDHPDALKYYIIDAYNHSIYPGDRVAKQFIQGDIDVHSHMSDEAFLQKVNNHVTRAIDAFQPEMVIYNAGTDCMVGDPLGCLSISE